MRFVKQHGIAMIVVPRMHAQLLLASHGLAVAQAFLERLQPTTILTECDRNSFSVPMILAAKSLGIPTVTMVHGVLNFQYGYTPLVADRIIAWGRKGRETLVKYGVPPEKIDVAGYPILKREAICDRAEVMARLNLPADRPVVLLATNPIEDSLRMKLVEAFCAAFNDTPDIKPLIRLHPSESLDFYRELFGRFPGVHFTNNATMTLDESLEVADVIVCHNSGYGFDALVKQKPVVVFDVIPEPLMSAAELIEEGGCPAARSGEELAFLVSRIINDEDFRTTILARGDRLVAATFDSLGERAAERTARCVRSAVNGQRMEVQICQID